ncbi:hypothetical protein MTO96_010289 [Rhipicephalus appendiculatus]
MTEAGRKILDDLGIGRSNEAETKPPLPKEIRRQTGTDPILKNMNPEYNKGRTARVKALIDLHANDAQARYVDAAKYQRNAFAAVIMKRRPAQRGRQLA